MAKKVQYIKIARIDQNGNDLTNTLESLTQITIPLTGAGNKTYKILTRADFPTYYLLTVDLENTPDAATLPSTTSTTLDYSFSGSLSDSIDASSFPTPFPITSGAGPQIFTDFYNSEQQRIEINTLPRKDISISIGDAPGTNFEVTVLDDGAFTDGARVELYKLSPPYNPSDAIQLTSNPVLDSKANPHTISRTASIPRANITPGDIVFLGAQEEAIIGPISINGARVDLNNELGAKFTGKFLLTSSAATGPELENIVEPYLERKFINSDCDVLINNVDQYQDNPFLQDIDFSSGTIVPVNYDQIITGTAQKATIPESMFTMGGMINPNNSAINSTSRYNTDNSSYTSQVSAGCFVAYWKTLFTTQSTTNKYYSVASLKYLISPDEELLEINSEPEMVGLLEQLYGANANPIDSINGEPNVFRNTSISFANTGSNNILALLTSNGEASSYTGMGYVLPFAGTVSILLFTSSSFSPNPTGTDSGGGLLFPTDINLTTHKTLPARARQILTENNIIPPQK